MANLERDLLFLLHEVSSKIRLEFDRKARAHGMTRAQWVIMWWIDRRPGLSQRELAEILEVEPITVARLLDRLEARGMLERRPDPADRRMWRLHLCPPSTSLIVDIINARADLAQQATSRLSPDGETQMVDALLTIKESLNTERRADHRDVA